MEPTYYSAPISQKTNGLDKKILIIIIGIFLAGLVAIALLLFGGKSGTGELLARSVVRQQNLYQLTQDAKKDIRGGDLNKINADANLFLSTDLGLLRTFMTNEGQKEIPKELVQSETDTQTTEKLKDTKLNSRYDDVYAQIFAQKIDAQQALLREISNKTNSITTKQGVSGIYDKLENIQKQLNAL